MNAHAQDAPALRAGVQDARQLMDAHAPDARQLMDAHAPDAPALEAVRLADGRVLPIAALFTAPRTTPRCR